LVLAYKLTDVDVHLLDNPDYDFTEAIMPGEEIMVPSSYFVEKYFTEKRLHGILIAVCKSFGWLELLEKYGNYMRVRVSKQEKTIGQMFGMIDDLRTEYEIDNYSVSQTTLEQIF